MSKLDIRPQPGWRGDDCRVARNLAGLAITGHLMITDAYWGSKTLEDVHEALAYFALGLVGLHVLGVFFTVIEHRENLVKAMITGSKRI